MDFQRVYWPSSDISVYTPTLTGQAHCHTPVIPATSRVLSRRIPRSRRSRVKAPELNQNGEGGLCALGKSVVLSSPLVLAGRKDRVQCKAGVQHKLCYARDCTVVGETERTDLGKRILRLRKYSFSGPSFQLFFRASLLYERQVPCDLSEKLSI